MILPCPPVPTQLPSLDEMLMTGTALSPEHEQILRSFLDQCHSYMSNHLADELVRLHAVLYQDGLSVRNKNQARDNIRSCMGEIRKVEEIIKTYRSLLSSIRRVPPEIWMSIFRLCLPNPYVSGPKTRTPTSPIYLSAVCSRWRLIVHNDPFLWSIIRISIPRKPYGWLHTSKHVLNSGTTPLHIYVSNTQNIAGKDDISLISEFIASTAHRWRTLHYSLPPYSAAGLPFREAHMSALEFLVVEYIPTWWTDPPIESRTPNLRHLTLCRNVDIEPQSVLNINSPLLTELDMTCFHTEDFFNDFFPRHQTLMRLKTTVLNWDMQANLVQGLHMDAVLLQHLQVLEVIIPTYRWNQDYTRDILIPFLRLFSLPSLRHLEMLDEGHSSVFSQFDLLVDYLATLQPPLPSLTLSGFAVLPPQSLQYARTNLSLQALRCQPHAGSVSPNLLDDGAI
ncbi:hypothetical protein BDZ89DRAFT_631892 [Hymenopellis radicata]|nr:hypothetical protein BDZ89DRAFT_631892 [Hymenopellis radicata]